MIYEAVTFLILAALLLWSIIAGRGWWPAKAAAVVAVGVFTALIWASGSSFSGWPTTQSPPGRSQFVQGVIVEPDSLSGSQGAIYVWLLPQSSTHRNPFSYDPSYGEPRAYKLPYSRALHQEVQGANQAVAQGKTVEFGTNVPTSGHGKQQGKPHGSTRAGRGVSRGGRYHAYVLPPATQPVKGQP